MNSDPRREAPVSPHPELFSSDHDTGVLFRGDHSFSDPDPTMRAGDPAFRLDLSSSFGVPVVPVQSSWTASDPWREQAPFSGWRGKAGAAGRVVARAGGEWTQRAPSDVCGPFEQNPTYDRGGRSYASSQVFGDLRRPDGHPVSCGLSPPTRVALWGLGPNCGERLASSGEAAASANYGSKCWMGRERKRSGEAAGLDGTGEGTAG